MTLNTGSLQIKDERSTGENEVSAPSPDSSVLSASTMTGHLSPESPPQYLDQSRRGSRIFETGSNTPHGSPSLTPQYASRSGSTPCNAFEKENTPADRSREDLKDTGVEPKDFGGLCTGSPSQNNDSEKEIPHHTFKKPFVWLLISLVSLAGAMSGLATNCFFPAQVDIATGLNIDVQTVNLSITTYLIAQALAPSFWGPLADFAGRRSILLATLCIYAIANLGLALTTNAGMLLGFRALQAIGSSSTIALGAGVIADITTPAERGSYLGMFSGMRQMSMAFGPVLGGLLAGSSGWRSIFWFLLSIGGAVVLAIALVLPETLRRIAGNGSVPLTKFQYKPLLYTCLPIGRKLKGNPTDLEEAAIKDAGLKEIKPRPPFRVSIFFEPLTYLLEKDVACALFFGATIYTSWSMMVACTSFLLKERYNFTTLEVGLAFLANGIGCVLGSILSGRSLNSTFRRESRLYQHSKYLPPTAPVLKAPLPLGFPIERARLGDAPMYCAMLISGLLIFGWSLTTISDDSELTGHWIVPLVAQFMVGYANTAVLNSNNTLVIDLYPGKSASASAVINLSRGVLAAVGVAVVDYLLEAMSPGWLSVVMVGLVLTGLGPYVLHVKYGRVWRIEREERRGSVAVSPM